MTIEGTLTEVSTWEDEPGKSDRIWWVVKFNEGFTLLVKMWNWEVDPEKNQRWWQALSSAPHTEFGILSEDVQFNLKNARFKVTNAFELNEVMPGNPMVLQLRLISN